MVFLKRNVHPHMLPDIEKRKKKESTAVKKLKRTRKQRDEWAIEIEKEKSNKKQRIEG